MRRRCRDPFRDARVPVAVRAGEMIVGLTIGVGLATWFLYRLHQWLNLFAEL